MVSLVILFDVVVFVHQRLMFVDFVDHHKIPEDDFADEDMFVDFVYHHKIPVREFVEEYLMFLAIDE
jgi:hypothetical protein